VVLIFETLRLSAIEYTNGSIYPIICPRKARGLLVPQLLNAFIACQLTKDMYKIFYRRRTRLLPIDCRCDDEKKNSLVGSISYWHQCAAEDSSIPKMLVINPLQALVHPQTRKKKQSGMDCQSPTPTSQNLPFFFK
jgi:hypothetical protein